MNDKDLVQKVRISPWLLFTESFWDLFGGCDHNTFDFPLKFKYTLHKYISMKSLLAISLESTPNPSILSTLSDVSL